MEIPHTRRYDKTSVEQLIREEAERGALSQPRLSLAAWLGDDLAQELVGESSVKAPRLFAEFWSQLAGTFGAEAGVRTWVAAASYLGKKKKYQSEDADIALAAAEAWATSPSAKTSEAARDVALDQMQRYCEPTKSARQAVATLAVHAAWSTGIGRLSMTPGEWSSLLAQATDATNTRPTTLRKHIVAALLPWALGLDEALWNLYSAGGRAGKRKTKKKAKKAKS